MGDDNDDDDDDDGSKGKGGTADDDGSKGGGDDNDSKGKGGAADDDDGQGAGGTLVLDGGVYDAAQVLGYLPNSASLILRNVPKEASKTITAPAAAVSRGLCPAYTTQNATWWVSTKAGVCVKDENNVCKLSNDLATDKRSESGPNSVDILLDDHPCFFPSSNSSDNAPTDPPRRRLKGSDDEDDDGDGDDEGDGSDDGGGGSNADDDDDNGYDGDGCDDDDGSDDDGGDGWDDDAGQPTTNKDGMRAAKCLKSKPWGVRCSTCEHGTTPVPTEFAAGLPPYLVTACQCAAGHAGSKCEVCKVGRYYPTAKTTIAAACQKCRAGQYQDLVGQAACKHCPAGKYNSESEATTCKACNKGKSSRVGAHGENGCSNCTTGTFANHTGSRQCMECAVGQYTDHTGQTQCKACKRGTKSMAASRSTTCTSCMASQYQDEAGQGACKQCITGRYTDQAASTGCKTCGMGKRSRAGANGCADCTAGTFANHAGSGQCLGCAAGQYTDEAGQAQCKRCKPGRATEGRAQSCVLCRNGTFALEFGAHTCAACSAGRFQADEGQKSCDRCPKGTFARSQGADRCEAAVQLGSEGAIADAAEVISSSFALQGFTKETFREQEQEAFIESVAAELGVHPADIVITAVAAPQGTHHRQSDAGAARRLAAGSAIIVTFEVISKPPPAESPPGGRAATHSSSGTEPQFSNATPAIPWGVTAKLQSTGFAATMVTRLHAAMTTANLAVPPGLGAALKDAPSSKRVMCKPGFFFEGAGLTEKGRCAPCPAGKFKSTAGSADATCRACEPHTVSGLNATRCLPCLEGKYQSQRGQPFCQVCPPNAEYAPSAPAGAPCVCTAKYFACPANTSVAYTPGQDCGDGHLAASERRKHAGACIACAAYATGADCSAPGSTLATLRSRRGFWRATAETAKFHACNPLNEGECKGGAIPVNGTRDAQCAAGHAGPKCEPCDRSHNPPYVRKFGGICETCAPGEGVGVMLVAPAALFAVAAFAWFLYRRHAARLRGLGDWMTERTIKTRILFGFVATVTRTQLVYGLQMPSVVARFYQALGFLELFDLSGFISNAACLLRSDYTTKVYVQTGLALGIMTALGASYTYVRHARKRSGSGVINAALFFAFLVFAPLLTTLLLAFGCTGYEDGRSYLAADLSIDCTDTHYHEMLKWAGFNVVVFVFGIPCVYYVLLRRHRAALQPEPCTANERREARVLGPDTWSHLMRVNDPQIQHLSFLWSGYKPGSWWFEVYEMARKFLMTGMPILITLWVGGDGKDSSVTIAYGLFVTVLTSTVHALGDPYINNTDQSLLLLTQFTVFVGLVAGQIMSAYENDTGHVQVGVTWLVLSTNLPIALLILYAFWRPGAADRVFAARWHDQLLTRLLDGSEKVAGASFTEEHVQPIVSALVEDDRLELAAEDTEEFVLVLARTLLRALLVHEAVRSKGGGRGVSHNTMKAAELEALDASIQAHANTKAVVAALGAAAGRRLSKRPPHAEEPMPSKDLCGELDRIERASAGTGSGVSAGAPAAVAPGNEEQPAAPPAAAAPADEKQLAVASGAAANV
eukprot:g2660.t1